MSHQHTYDVIVIGGGHAGVEAALASARTGSNTLLLTQNIETIGQMSCNPAIGGLGKSHLVKEIDALGGVMAYAADCAGIHFRILNTRKGPAVRATRAQTDRQLYRMAIRRAIETEPKLKCFQQNVEDFIIKNNFIHGVVTHMNMSFYAPAVVLTTGTFLGGCIHVGNRKQQSGRAGDPPANALAARLRELPFEVGRLKTGTPPRIDGRTINYDHLPAQATHTPLPVFSFLTQRDIHPEQTHCHITQTNEKTHAIIRENLHQSPIYSGAINTPGPRYCPSIEDKVVRFADKSSHRIFIEPEGLNTSEIYPNGISTSLPFEVQEAFVRTIDGFESAHITRPGYAIEYDYFNPTGLKHSLQTRTIKGLFFAGQINGTTGYEEAAAQGLVAGINASRYAQSLDPWYPQREESYLGVLIDDLITQGVSEPYRMFTSRVEYRLLLREDNADLRLTPIGRELGVVDDVRWQQFETKREQIVQVQQHLQDTLIHPSPDVLNKLSDLNISLKETTSAANLLRRPDVCYADIALLGNLPLIEDERVVEQIEIQAHYAGYTARQIREIEQAKNYSHRVIPSNFRYDQLSGLSNELREKLILLRPNTLGQANRVQGMTPAAMSLLLVHLKHHKPNRNSA